MIIWPFHLLNESTNTCCQGFYICFLFCYSTKEIECKASDLKTVKELGRGAYGVVEKMVHRAEGYEMAVKVRTFLLLSYGFDFLLVISIPC